MPKLKIDNREIEVPKGTRVIEAAQRLGIIIPRFCFHPALGAVGACRVCAVKFVDGPVKGIQMSCMTEARDGMVVSTTDEEALDFRRQVIEWLMMNHPHDCPVCDEGGHCLLQDLTIAGGHGIRRYLGKKRTYLDQELGPLVQHEMNRCIHCYRCWRYYQEFSGYRDLGCMQNANRTYFGRYSDGPLESPFAGNLIDLCPTGVYTDKPSRFTGRRWEFERHPSLCIHCSLGCNTVTSGRYRAVVRQEARLNPKVNGYFICDRGRYGFSYAGLAERPRRARVGGKESSWEEALPIAAEALGRVRRNHGAGAIASLGSTRSSLENLAMLKRVCRTQGWREPAFFNVASDGRKARSAVARLAPRLAVSLGEIEQTDFVLAVGADPVNEAPLLALAMRQAVRRKGTAAVLDPRPVSLPFDFHHVPIAPGELDVCLSVLVKRTLDRSVIAGLGQEALRFYDRLPTEYPVDEGRKKILTGLEAILRESKKTVIVCGTDIVGESTPAWAADHALLLREAKGEGGLFYLLPGANGFGAALLSAEKTSLEEIVEGIEQGAVKALLIVENDPLGFYPEPERLKRALERLDLLLVMDYLPSATVALAQVFLPTASLFETRASFVNQEGRRQFAEPVHAGGISVAQAGGGSHPPRRFGEGMPGAGPRPAWEILAELGRALSPEVPLEKTVEDLWGWIVQTHPVFGGAGVNGTSSAGARLSLGNAATPFSSAPSGPAPPGEGLELLLVDWTFGTEELSGYSPSIQKVEPPPCLFMHPDDAGRLGLKDREPVVLHLAGGPLAVTLSVAANMAPGVLVLPRHRQLPWQKGVAASGRIPLDRIRKAE